MQKLPVSIFSLTVAQAQESSGDFERRKRIALDSESVHFSFDSWQKVTNIQQQSRLTGMVQRFPLVFWDSAK